MHCTHAPTYYYCPGERPKNGAHLTASAGPRISQAGDGGRADQFHRRLDRPNGVVFSFGQLPHYWTATVTSGACGGQIPDSPRTYLLPRPTPLIESYRAELGDMRSIAWLDLAHDHANCSMLDAE